MTRTPASRLLPLLAATLLLGASAARAQPPCAGGGFEHPLMCPRSRIGLQVQPMTPELREHMGAPADFGVLVARVEPERPAAAAGVEVGDVVVGAGEENVGRPFDLLRVVARVPAGQSLELRVVRDGKERTIAVAPEGDPQPWMDPERWGREWMHRGMGLGREELQRRLDELERHLDELQRRFDEKLGAPPADGHTT
jgi:hypothetical protein